jgi:protein SCO1
MKKYFKAGMLTLLLVLPAFIILFLHGFAENHFKLPYLVPKLDTNGSVIMNKKDTVFYQIPDGSSNKIQVIGFFADSAVAIAQQMMRVERLRMSDVVIKRVGEEKVALEKYKPMSLEKKKPKKTILYHEQFMLIDKQGYIRGRYDATDPVDVDRLLAEIKILQDIYAKQ